MFTKYPYIPVKGDDKMTRIFTALSALIMVISSCSPIIDYRRLLERDILPPVFLGIKVLGDNSLKVRFSENVTVQKKDFFIIPETPAYTITAADKAAEIKFSSPLVPGGSYKLKMTVTDAGGNSLTLINSFYGYNPDIPGMLINEFTTQGSSANPDRVEIVVTSDGNTAGAVIYEGSDYSWEQRKVFPSIVVKEGDFIVVHFKSTGDPAEIDETTSKNQSGGVKPSAEGWDLWVEGGTGLSGNNGTLMLFTALYGDLMDGLLYSNRTSGSDEKYRGFGSTKVMDRADRLMELKGWKVQGDIIAPEDGINPEDSTATRSMNRDSLSTDSNSKDDWHIVPTSTSTFGTVNSDLVYTP